MYHLAAKKVPFYDQESGEYKTPTEPNAYKFELFIHNFLPLCAEGKVGAVKVNRHEEFGPVKNANGDPNLPPANDSPLMALEMMSNLNVGMVTAKLDA